MLDLYHELNEPSLLRPWVSLDAEFMDWYTCYDNKYIIPDSLAAEIKTASRELLDRAISNIEQENNL